MASRLLAQEEVIYYAYQQVRIELSINQGGTAAHRRHIIKPTRQQRNALYACQLQLALKQAISSASSASTQHHRHARSTGSSFNISSGASSTCILPAAARRRPLPPRKEHARPAKAKYCVRASIFAGSRGAMLYIIMSLCPSRRKRKTIARFISAQRSIAKRNQPAPAELRA